MNFKKLTGDTNKQVLVNFDNVCEIHPAIDSGSSIFFNVATDGVQESLSVKETMTELIAILAV